MFRNPLTDIIVVLVIVLLFFGPKRLPALGQGLREFKDTLTGGDHKDEDEAERPTLTSAAAQPGAAQPQPAERHTSEPRP